LTTRAPEGFAAPTAALAPGLPDPAMLARLANDFFAALPGAAPSGVATAGGPAAVLPALNPSLGVLANPAPPGSPLAGPGGFGTGVPGTPIPLGQAPGINLVPASHSSVLSLGQRAPSLLPHAQAQNGLPDQVVTVAPALDGRLGGAALGVPNAQPASAPAAHAAPYYFLNPSHGLLRETAGAGDASQAATSGVPQGTAPPWAGNNELTHGVNAPSSLAHFDPLGLPAHGDFAGIANAPLAPARHAQGVPYTSPAALSAVPAAPGGGRYFLDASQARPAGSNVPQAGSSVHAPFDVQAIRRDFPILQERINGRQLVWFDNAATTHKPQAVIDRIAYFYAHENSNIHRAAHALAGRATDAYEAAREKVRQFIGASSVNEIVFVRGATEAINLVANSWGAQHIGEGDEIIVSNLEHHANIVPWQQLAAAKGAKLRVIPVDDSGQVLLDEYQKLLNSRTKLVAVTQVSNALGTVVPVRQIIELAHRAGALALVDGAQSVSHMRVDVQALDADFFVFSGHKVFGPTGIGVVYGKRAVLEDMPPWQGGGNMIADVTFERTVFQDPPNRFEAGTGNIADAVGLGAAIDYVNRVGIENIARYEHDLLAYATRRLQPVPGVRLIGTAADKASVLSFVLAGYSTEEVGRALNEEGIAVRSGHHCAQPILRRFGVETTVRPSLAFYNTTEEVDALVRVVQRLASARS
jgi:cysteine desulfurase/selenocysteine lyase